MPAPQVLGGRYELRGVLGRGGMGEVRDGWDTRLDRPVAIKLLLPALATQSEIRRRFEAEARSAATLSHPHVIAVHDSGEDGGIPYIVMERLPGRTLADDLTGGPLPRERVRTILTEVLEAVAAAHDAGILHRDLKPGNILFTATGAVKVADFGIAKSLGAEHTLTQTGELLGTVAYLSPERLAGNPATVTDDLYAVGVLGYEALCGHRPFERDNPAALVRAILDEPPPPLAAERGDVDPALATAIDRALARDPRRRYLDARVMLAAVRSRGSEPVTVEVRAPTRVLAPPSPALVSASTPVGTDRVPHRGLARVRVTLAPVLVAVALVAVALVAVTLVGSRGQDGTPPPVAVPTPAGAGPLPAPLSNALDELDRAVQP
ncbi:serine/threonine protein kinase [Rhodococcus sp. HM1]|uniref:serine/threonine-protein kinase n=1 Tax=unclassified Rhodococcus (in: high G+C Gram-positive bacteria) TaxID=192944 RepID=UPI0018CFB8BB|nr:MULTISPECIES: serine/threonine-protein kinase [unclassified Rhodococcus (in: high G+C Gram-positive bacteria)]MBH0123098.1 serine/threonine protein kinase [Rhodococcus sp. CX]MCK8672645.1 serine/threonine protein kinase [Rhodococcus sp. HM1]